MACGCKQVRKRIARELKSLRLADAVKTAAIGARKLARDARKPRVIR